MGREYRVRDFNEMQSRQRDGAWAAYDTLTMFSQIQAGHMGYEAHRV